jgi:pyrroloquinoline quinone biosynthesis protein B
MFDATPDFPEQLRDLCLAAPARPKASPPLDGIFLTHAHIGHYTGLMYLGHEAMGTRGVKVFAMARMRSFLENSGPWSQLVKYGNIALEPLTAGEPVDLGRGLRVTPFLVPHRQEYSEVVGFRIDGPGRRALFIPDIDSWEEWDASGVRLEDAIAGVDIAFLDGTFFADGELPGRDMKTVPHPLIRHTMDRLGALSVEQRRKVRFIHLNHTNPALWPESDARREVLSRGFGIADEGQVEGL